MPSDAEDSAGLPPSGTVAQHKFDAELVAMLDRAATSIGLEWNLSHCPKCLRLDDWDLKFVSGPKCPSSQKCMEHL